MTRGKVQLQRITDDKSRLAMFARRKQGLFKKAMELSVLCDCDVAVIVFGPPGSAGQRLYQYSSANMDDLLERYAGAVEEPHERRRNGELLRHYYELSPDEDEEGMEDGDAGCRRGGMDGAPNSAAAAATMEMVDRIILGGGGAGRRQEGAGKRMRTHSPAPGGLPMAGGVLAAPGGQGGISAAGGGLAGSSGLGGGPPGVGAPNGMSLPPLMGGTPLRRLTPVGGLPLEGVKAAGFLDKRKYPLSPRSERAYEDITAAFEALTELRAKQGGGAGPQGLTTSLQPLSSSAAGPFSLASQQQHLQQLLLRQQQQKQLQQLEQQQQSHQHQQQQVPGGGGKRFKPLSILVPDMPTQPIIPTNVTPITSNAGAAPAASSAGPASGATPPGLRAPGGGPHSQQPHSQAQQQQQGAGGLPPRPPQSGRLTPRTAAGRPQGYSQHAGGSGGAASISPVSGSLLGAGQHGGGGAAETTGGGGGGSGGAFAFERRSGGALGSSLTSEDALGGLLGGPSFRTSLDGTSAAALLSMPSPPPHGATASLFGSLDGGPLSIRSSSSHGMLASLGGLGLGLERGASLGLGGSLMGMGLLESPGPTGLAPMDVLDWPSSSPRSSAGNGDGTGSDPGPGSGGFPDEGEGDGDGGTVLDDLVVRGTALSKLAPDALEAAIGPSPDVSSGGGTPGSARGAGVGRVGTPQGGSTSSGGTPVGVSAFAVTAQGDAQVLPPAHSRPRRVSASDGAGEVGSNAAGEGTGASKAVGELQAPEQPESGQEQRKGQAEQGDVEGEGGKGDDGEGVGAFMAAPDGLVSELSFNDFGLRGRAGSAAAAAAVLAAAAAQQQQITELQQQRKAAEAQRSPRAVARQVEPQGDGGADGK